MENNRRKLEIDKQCVIFVNNYKNVYDDQSKLIDAFSSFGIFPSPTN